MAERRQYPLKRQLRDARREHLARPYPGDLAEDLGLTGRPVARAWGLRLGIAAAVALTALLAGAWLMQHSPADPARTTAESRSDMPQHADGDTPSNHVDAAQNNERRTPLRVFARIDPKVFQVFQDRFASASQRADLEAQNQLSTRWGGRVTPPLPGCSTTALSAAIDGAPHTPSVSIELPEGLHLPTLTVPTLPRKDLS